ncbi:unnamed protein product [Chondrus crispus]|uniref:Uncharacterized protein n=1 Tax=Chondrus crispus TaxID=2769 RepID=R7QHN2_CHOCR|nr:unnamed protein product [Chondrus crispus]CDF37283.1 unnamed protein product [Chondrus crispus]|eukprot:XP_005717102.1 unnamed protein product [Chondrus crispus]
MVAYSSCYFPKIKSHCLFIPILPLSYLPTSPTLPYPSSSLVRCGLSSRPGCCWGSYFCPCFRLPLFYPDFCRFGRAYSASFRFSICLGTPELHPFLS